MNRKRRATMHINRKPGEQVEVDWAGDPATIIDPDTGEILKVYIFVGVMTYSQYAYVEAFLDMKQKSWITAHVHMYEFFGGVARILVPDNCKTAVVHNGGWKDQQINETYQEMAEHYGTAIIPARVRTPKDKPNAEGTVGNISTWITAALRNEQFFSLVELNRVIREKLEQFNRKLFQKKEGSRLDLFLEDEKPLLSPLPATRFELSDWKTATNIDNITFNLLLFTPTPITKKSQCPDKSCQGTALQLLSLVFVGFYVQKWSDFLIYISGIAQQMNCARPSQIYPKFFWLRRTIACFCFLL